MERQTTGCVGGCVLGFLLTGALMALALVAVCEDTALGEIFVLPAAVVGGVVGAIVGSLPPPPPKDDEGG